MRPFTFNPATDGYFVDVFAALAADDVVDLPVGDPDFPEVTIVDRYDDAATVSADRYNVYLEGIDDGFIFTAKDARKLAKALKRAARYIEAQS